MDHPTDHLMTDYYHFFESDSGSLGESRYIDMSGILRLDRAELDELVKMREGNNELNILVLGCATSKNISHIDNFLQRLRDRERETRAGEDSSEKRTIETDENHVIIIDISDIPLSNIKKRLEKKQRDENTKQNYSIVKMDMNQMAFADESVDLIFSDFSVNFNTELSKIDAMFSEINRVLKGDGVVYMNLMAKREDQDTPNDKADLVKKTPTLINMTSGLKVDVFPYEVYKNYAAKNGLDMRLIKSLTVKTENNPETLFIWTKITKK